MPNQCRICPTVDKAPIDLMLRNGQSSAAINAWAEKQNPPHRTFGAPDYSKHRRCLDLPKVNAGRKSNEQRRLELMESRRLAKEAAKNAVPKGPDIPFDPTGAKPSMNQIADLGLKLLYYRMQHEPDKVGAQQLMALLTEMTRQKAKANEASEAAKKAQGGWLEKLAQEYGGTPVRVQPELSTDDAEEQAED